MSAPTRPTLYAPGSLTTRPMICLYGRSGVGKTTLMGTWPGEGLLIETARAEGAGDIALADQAGRIQVYYINEWDQLDELYTNWLLKDPDLPFKWIGIDTATGLRALATEKELQLKGRAFGAAVPHVDPQDWGNIARRMIEMVQKLGHLTSRPTGTRVTVLWVAQERKFSQDDDQGSLRGESFIGPDVGSISVLAGFAPAMTATLHLRAYPSGQGEMERILRVTPTLRHLVKCRAASPTWALPEQIRIHTPPRGELADLFSWALRGDAEALGRLEPVRDEASALFLDSPAGRPTGAPTGAGGGAPADAVPGGATPTNGLDTALLS